jgi:CRP-like cAMP-binding protein
MAAPEIEPLLLKLMSSVALFRELEREDLATVLRGTAKVAFAPGNLVFEEGAAGGASMYVVVRGKFEVFKQVDGCDAHIAYVHPGEHFGEMALVTDRPRTASVRALEQSIVLRLGKETLFAKPSVAVCMLKSIVALMAEELRERNTEVLLLDVSRKDKFKAGTPEPAKVEEPEKNAEEPFTVKVHVQNKNG